MLRLRLLATLGAALPFLTLSAPASAALTINIEQLGDDVLVQGQGKLTFGGPADPAHGQPQSFFLDPAGRAIYVGRINQLTAYTVEFQSSASFGSGRRTESATSSGDLFGFALPDQRIVVPFNYVSGSPLMASNTYTGATLASLGLIEGAYQYGFLSGGVQDTIFLKIGSGVTPPINAVPEPGAWALMVCGLAVIGGARRLTFRGIARS